MSAHSPYHPGELAVQDRAQKRASADLNGRVIDSAIPGAALGFIRQQSMAVLASVDRTQRPWASLLFGIPGFLLPESPHRVTAELARAWTEARDPLWDNLRGDARLGMLLIELETRRRLRLNGAASLGNAQLSVAVHEAYPNCPKYIQRRRQTGARARVHASPTPPAAVEPAVRGRALSADQQVLIAGADTLFVASHHPAHGADASHRGGTPGFLRVVDERTLRVPDYPGNNMFNTLGNFVVHPAGGVLVPDFVRRRTLQLVGRVALQWDQEEPGHPSGGTHRYWDLAIEETLELPMPVHASWELLDASPFNP